MSRYARDTTAIMRDVVIALRHPDYADVKPIDAIRDLKRKRGEYV